MVLSQNIVFSIYLIFILFIYSLYIHKLSNRLLDKVFRLTPHMFSSLGPHCTLITLGTVGRLPRPAPGLSRPVCVHGKTEGSPRTEPVSVKTQVFSITEGGVTKVIFGDIQRLSARPFDTVVLARPLPDVPTYE